MARMAEQGNRTPSIWWLAFGYFAAYAPYSALTKYMTRYGGVGGTELLPPTAMASLVGMFLFISAMRWWKHAGSRTVLGLRIPVPGRWTFLSGLCTAAIIPTTTLAYTFSGISIVFMMLLMRGGVLILAPVVDVLARRKVGWPSRVALALSLCALVVAFAGRGSFAITLVAFVDVAVYLAAYFVRLRFMSRLAKSEHEEDRKRYFVEEQMVATPTLVLTLALVALFGQGPFARDLAAGFTTFFHSDMVPLAIVVGLLSQGTGVFGGLILLDRRENTFCVPVNRASSVLAGLLAALLLTWLVGEPHPPLSEWTGAGLVLAAIVVLSLRPVLGGSKR